MKRAKFFKVEQNTEEWLELRKGKFTASSFKNLMSDKSKAAYKNEIYRVVYERLTGESPDTFTNEYMERGHELEPFARKEYEQQTFNEVKDGGFFLLNDFVGCSPDGLIDKDGGLEIKSPKYNTHIDYLLSGKLPNEYKWQVQGHLYVTGRKWWDFMTYEPKMKPLILRVEPDAIMFSQLEAELNLAIEQVKELVIKLKAA